MKKLFLKLKNWFVKKHISKNDYIDPETGDVTRSSLITDRSNNRFLQLDNSSCGFIMHQDGKVEVIFTKLYDSDDQQLTPEEEFLMALAIFMKQPGFSEMLVHEFHNIAMQNTNFTNGEINE